MVSADPGMLLAFPSDDRVISTRTWLSKPRTSCVVTAPVAKLRRHGLQLGLGTGSGRGRFLEVVQPFHPSDVGQLLAASIELSRLALDRSQRRRRFQGARRGSKHAAARFRHARQGDRPLFANVLEALKVDCVVLQRLDLLVLLLVEDVDPLRFLFALRWSDRSAPC